MGDKNRDDLSLVCHIKSRIMVKPKRKKTGGTKTRLFLQLFNDVK